MECDACNRWPDSQSNGVRLCSDCKAIEDEMDGDLGAVYERLAHSGLASNQARGEGT